MRMSLELLSGYQIASPCPVSWESMSGTECVRHCSHCNQTVYNLSSLTADEALALIQEKEGTLCVKLYRRRDGTVLTADCPKGIRHRFRHFWRCVTAAVVALVSCLFLYGFAQMLNYPDGVEDALVPFWKGNQRMPWERELLGKIAPCDKGRQAQPDKANNI